ncbi:FxsA family protein [Sporolactobacillus kofuensis]|uniref:FxsA family protein n=1 Tax=Sporolactobacillus kofuensis TaxID=269672 RepID=A0ABW1W9R4_9BACL|nr:FxsA family protein [Sporolactobacillus kofuensis]MCO7175944.1 FxsA family protein [Sporolactobacillus kofuensis]
MLRKMLIFLMLYALLEVCLFIYVGHLIGGLNLIIIVLLSALFGIWMVKRQGFVIVQRIRDAFMQRQIPSDSVLDGACLLLGGLLLCLPGLISDCIGILLLIPVLRVAFVIRIRRFLRKWFSQSQFFFRSFKK